MHDSFFNSLYYHEMCCAFSVLTTPCVEISVRCVFFLLSSYPMTLKLYVAQYKTLCFILHFLFFLFFIYIFFSSSFSFISFILIFIFTRLHDHMPRFCFFILLFFYLFFIIFFFYLYGTANDFFSFFG